MRAFFWETKASSPYVSERRYRHQERATDKGDVKMARTRRVKAHRLRRKAERYRTLARTNGDDRDVEMMETKATEYGDEASRIEDEISEEASSG